MKIICKCGCEIHYFGTAKPTVKDKCHMCGRKIKEAGGSAPKRKKDMQKIVDANEKLVKGMKDGTNTISK